MLELSGALRSRTYLWRRTLKPDPEVAADVRGSDGHEAVDANHEEKKEPDQRDRVVPEVVNAEQESVNATLPQ